MIFSDLHIGDSVAVNGVCLTAAAIDGNVFSADVMNETLGRTSLGRLAGGDAVNLERAMPSDGRFGGHIVSGHIDGTGTVVKIEKDGNAVRYTVSASDGILKYIVEKGSVALDGISLTVAGVTSGSFSVSVVPHTVRATSLSEKRIGSLINIENDVIGKYVEKLLSARPAGNEPTAGHISESFLMKHGF